ncbi:ABC transporter substrate-binding protein [Jiella mangrovi]|uniref:ABC transporter substrate-binding protein n=1 Tax=Jiella mangrovi TaxID=2821407 RepID=A0ABS4BE05_9HYPH|nr:ABC transporter substrate-binding protein [Jiella mangrovi]MBP0614985.1 ABC transporter substrate-binding protein [Jiella mangrovi]
MRALATLTAFFLVASPALAQESGPIVIGVAAPLSDAQDILGRQVTDGVAAALAADKGKTETVIADTSCSAKGGEDAAKTFVEKKAAIVVGFLCVEAIEAALPILKKAGIATIDVGVRANRLTDDNERNGYLIKRLAPRSDDEAAALTRYITARWGDKPFGLIDDGSIAARGLVDAVRRLLADEGLQPQTVDNYRPAEEKQFGLARRLQRTGVTRFFIAGDRPDIAIIARDAKETGLDLDILGAEGLFDEASVDTPLPAGIIAIGPKTSFPELAPQPEDAASDPGYLPPQGYFGTAYAAAEIATQAAAESRSSGDPLAKILSTKTFDTGLGPVRFDAKGDGNLDLFRVYEWRGDEFVEETGG